MEEKREDAVVDTVEEKTEEVVEQKGSKKTKNIKVNVEVPHKCLLYWHMKGVGTIPIGKNEKLMVYPGYNTFDSNRLNAIIANTKEERAAGIITFRGIKISVDENGKLVVKETEFLDDMGSKDIREIVGETLNPDTLDDLSNPDVVGALHQDLASERKKVIEAATGHEPDNIDTSGDNSFKGDK